MRRWLAWLVSVEVRRLHVELAHVRVTRRLIARTASLRNDEALRLRARVQELEQLLLNPNTRAAAVSIDRAGGVARTYPEGETDRELQHLVGD